MSAVDRMWRRVQHAMGFARTTTAANESGNVATVQIRLNDIQLMDDCSVVFHFGFQSSLPIGTDVVRVGVAGDLKNSVIVASNHIASRSTALGSGGSRMFDAGGRQVLLNNDGIIALQAPGETLHRLLTELAMAVYNEHTHPTPSGTSGPPNQMMTAADLTTATKAGT